MGFSIDKKKRRRDYMRERRRILRLNEEKNKIYKKRDKDKTNIDLDSRINKIRIDMIKKKNNINTNIDKESSKKIDNSNSKEKELIVRSGNRIPIEDIEQVTDKRISSMFHEVKDLLPQLVQEIREYELINKVKKGRKITLGTEKNLWLRFLKKYTSTFGNLSKATDYCGISRNHYYRALDRYPTLNALIQIVQERFLDNVEETTMRHALLPNSVVERMFLLQNLRKAKYGKEKEPQNAPVQVVFQNLHLMRKPLDIKEELSKAKTEQIMEEEVTIDVN